MNNKAAKKKIVKAFSTSKELQIAHIKEHEKEFEGHLAGRTVEEYFEEYYDDYEDEHGSGSLYRCVCSDLGIKMRKEAI